MSDRLPTGLIVAAMIRRVNDAGGAATVLAKGDAQAGVILVIGVDRGRDHRIWERGIGPNGRVALIVSTPTGSADEYWQRRRSSDPDLWVVELDTPQAERFAAEMMLDD